MAEINIWGIDISTGQMRPLSSGDVPIDSQLQVSNATGIRGGTGITGFTGFMGPPGTTGLQGQTGVLGRTGIVGISPANVGLQGQSGLQGETGLLVGTGMTGATGIRGLTGTAGAGNAAYSFLTSATTITSSAKILGIDTTGGPFTVTLPPSAGLFVGQEFIVQDEAGLASTNNITIATSGADLISGSSSHVMTTNYEGVDILFGGGTRFYKTVSKYGATGLLAQGITGAQGSIGVSGQTGLQGQTGVA